jgi:hypothetical protein
MTRVQIAERDQFRESKGCMPEAYTLQRTEGEEQEKREKGVERESANN